MSGKTAAILLIVVFLGVLLWYYFFSNSKSRNSGYKLGKGSGPFSKLDSVAKASYDSGKAGGQRNIVPILTVAIIIVGIIISVMM